MRNKNNLLTQFSFFYTFKCELLKPKFHHKNFYCFFLSCHVLKVVYNLSILYIYKHFEFCYVMNQILDELNKNMSMGRYNSSMSDILCTMNFTYNNKKGK